MTKQKRIINREISWLSFNERVLQEAADKTVPLVERMRFLGIFSNNLDEFFKVRVATIKRMIDFKEGVKKKSDSTNPKKILNQIQTIVLNQQKIFHKCYQDILIELGKQDIFIIDEKELSEEQSECVQKYFQEEVSPVLSTIMLQHMEEFPYLKDKSIYLSVKLSRKDEDVKTEYALIEIPTDDLSRFLVLPCRDNKKYIILLDDVIRHCIDKVFATFNFDKFQAYTIKLTRDAELDIDNDLTKTLLEKISQGVSHRSKGQPVRFVYDSSIPKDLLNFFIEKLNIEDDDNIIPGSRYHNFKDFMKFPNVGGDHLEYKSKPPTIHRDIPFGTSFFKVLDKKDVLLHFPYQSFSHYINLLREASIDPKVTSIKTSLYRVASKSKVCNALINACRNGKKVTVVIELQARFDETSNIYWSQKLEEAGAKVIFGVRGLKVHSKLTLFSRTDGKKQKLYGTVGTGNFHEGTARVYSDVSYFTSNKKITNELFNVFEFFENNYKVFHYKHLLVSPLYLRKKFVSLINNEIDNAKAGKNAYIIIKLNSLVDDDMINKLYEANNAGVKIKLIIRGICSLIPRVPGISENIEAISVIGKFLEHTRVWVFCNNDDEKYFMGSADWMQRNLDNRVEVVTPIYDKNIQKDLKKMLDLQLADNVKARIIDANQENKYKKDNSPKKIQAQQDLYDYYVNIDNPKK